MKYIKNDKNSISIDGTVIISTDSVIEAINFCNNAIRKLYEQTKEFDINIFEILGMRNLSGMMGEYFAKSVQKHSSNCLQSNLHQDGYPDLILTNTSDKLNYYKSLYTIVNGKIHPKDKSFFSPYKYGGIEIKATCGTTPSAKIMAKPIIGEKRIDKMVSFDWKAHHRQTNNLLAILWDFINDVPTIVACFYRNDLVIDDWGKIVQPKIDGGRTTSVSIMTSLGVSKMCKGWIAIIDDDEYINKLSHEKWIGYRIKS